MGDEDEEDDGSDADDDGGVEDSPETESQQNPHMYDESDETSEFPMIRINTQTDLQVDSPLAYLSKQHPHSSSSPSGSSRGGGPPDVPDVSPIKPRPSPKSSSKSSPQPSASLRIQHNDVWLNQFILPRAHDEAKAAKLEV